MDGYFRDASLLDISRDEVAEGGPGGGCQPGAELADNRNAVCCLKRDCEEDPEEMMGVTPRKERAKKRQQAERDQQRRKEKEFKF